MNRSRAFPAASAAIVFLMSAAASAMTARAASPLQLRSAVPCLAVSLVGLGLLYRGRLLRWLRSPALPPGLRIVGGALCLAAAAIATKSGPAPFLSFPSLNALWIVLLGCLMVTSVLADWAGRDAGKA